MDLEGVDLTDPSLFLEERHHGVFTELRGTDPVHWQDDGAGPGADHGFWSLTRHADVVAANRDAATFVSGQGFTLADMTDDAAALTMLPAMDGARHHRLRRLVSRGFTPRVLSLLEAHLAAKARAIVDGVTDRGACDFVVDVAAELPLQAIADLLGIPPEDRQRIFEWSNRMIGIDDPEYAGDRTEQVGAAAEMYAYANELRARRMADPRDDIVTTLTNAEIDGDHLTDTEFGMFFLLLAVAGNETTRNATAHGLRALADHPDQWAALQADPSRERMDRAVEEILRWASPVLYFRRTAIRDVEIGGRQLRAGDRVLLWYVSANRDEAVFADPFRFDTQRWPNEQVAFGGGGPHFCLGANLARMELRLVFTELVTRWRDVELTGPPEMLNSNFVGGIKHLPVRWTARRPDAAAVPPA